MTAFPAGEGADWTFGLCVALAVLGQVALGAMLATVCAGRVPGPIPPAVLLVLAEPAPPAPPARPVDQPEPPAAPPPAPAPPPPPEPVPPPESPPPPEPSPPPEPLPPTPPPPPPPVRRSRPKKVQRPVPPPPPTPAPPEPLPLPPPPLRTQPAEPVFAALQAAIRRMRSPAAPATSTRGPVRPDPAPAGPPGPVRAGDPPAVAAWLARVRRAVERDKRYPEEGRARRLEGRVTVVFTVDRDGRVKGPAIEGGGQDPLSRAALALLAGRRFPPPPSEWNPAAPIRLPIHFSLR